MSKSLTKQLKEKREEIKNLEFKIQELKIDRDHYRIFFIERLKEQLKAAGANEYYTATDQIQKLARLLTKVQSWYWS